MSISDQTFEPYGITIYSRGAQAFRDALFNILRDRYPSYQTIMMGASWQRLLGQYQQALEQINSAQRRGIEALTDQKSGLALLFEQRQYAGFESYAKQYNGLVEVVDWRGDSGAIVLHRHPQENTLIEAISVDSGLSENQVYVISREQGYLSEETEYLIDFLLLRGYNEHAENDARLVLASTFTQDELIGITRQTLDELAFIKGLVTSTTQEQLSSQLDLLLASLEAGSVDLSGAQVRLLQYQRQIQALRKQIVVDLRTNVQQKIEELYRYRARFDEPLPESSTGTFLDSHINGAQRTLQKDIASLSSRIQKRITAMRKTLERSIELDSGDFTSFEDYVSQVQSQQQFAGQEESGVKALLAQCSTHHDWVQLVDRLKRLKDITAAAADFTDTELLEQTIDRIQWNIQQELASEGLKQYRPIYNRFVGSVNEMQRELDTLSRLVETRSRNGAVTEAGIDETRLSHQSHTEIPTESQHEDIASEHSETEHINLKAMFEDSAIQAKEFLRHLIDLNETGEILVYRRKKRK